MAQRFLGWDCANKSLAWSHIIVDTHVYKKLFCIAAELRALIENKKTVDYAAQLLRIINTANDITDNFIICVSAGVADILNGEKVYNCNEIERTAALVSFVRASPICKDNLPADTNILIEHQPAKIGIKTNNKSTMIGHQLMFYYSDFTTELVSPKLKTNIKLANNLSISDFLGAAEGKSAKYKARKMHSKRNFLYFLKVFKLEHITTGVPAANMDDMADSFIQILAWLVENNKFSY